MVFLVNAAAIALSAQGDAAARAAARQAFLAGPGVVWTNLNHGAIFAIYLVVDGDETAPASLASAFPERVMGSGGGGAPPAVAVPLASLDEAWRHHALAEELPLAGSLILSDGFALCPPGPRFLAAGARP